MSRRTITTEVTEEDKRIEGSLRPQTLDEYIGQERIKSTLKVFIHAAKSRGEALDHVLFYGPPGLGKTTLSGIIANEMGTRMKVTSGPAIEKPGEIAAILNGLQEGDVLFVDEILKPPGGRGALSGDGGLCDRYHVGKRFDGALDSSGSAEIYAGRRDDTRGASDGAAARPLWHRAEDGFLYA